VILVHGASKFLRRKCIWTAIAPLYGNCCWWRPRSLPKARNPANDLIL